MLVVEKTRHIEAQITGTGTDTVISLIKEHYPDAAVFDDDNGYENWDETDIAKEIRTNKTPGKLLNAYRIRAGLTVTELAKAAGTKYPNISAMENDRRAIGLDMARRLGKALNVDYQKFLGA
jgi:DNA-binding XRE family transcriptional regulator